MLSKLFTHKLPFLSTHFISLLPCDHERSWVQHCHTYLIPFLPPQPFLDPNATSLSKHMKMANMTNDQSQTSPSTFVFKALATHFSPTPLVCRSHKSHHVFYLIFWYNHMLGCEPSTLHASFNHTKSLHPYIKSQEM